MMTVSPSFQDRYAVGGFSLLEVMIALSILAIGIFTLFGSMGISSNVARNVSEHEIVVQAMENRMEQMQAGRWAMLVRAQLNDSSEDAPAGCRDIGRFGVSGIQPIAGEDNVITVRIARWHNDSGAFHPIAYDLDYSLSQDPTGSTGYYRDLITDERVRGPWAFDIMLINLRADWTSSIGEQTASMEFILVDRDDQDDN